MRLGFFGGTFDPPHRGHLAVAEAVAQAFSLDRVLLAPVARQPLKDHGPSAGFSDRLAMVEILCRHSSVLSATGIDAPRPDGGPNFTVDTLARLRSELGPEDSLYILTGADAFLGIHNWHSPAALLDAADWIVVSRPGFDLSRIPQLGLSPAQLQRVHLLPGINEPVSASDLRDRLRQGLDCSRLVPSGILEYIRAHHLYGA